MTISAEISVPKQSREYSKSNRSNVLIADDDPITRKLLCRHLQSARYEMIEATDGKQAIEAMHDGVAVVLLDLHMPGFSGMECLERIHKDFPDAQVIMVTSSDDVSHAVEAMKLDAAEYVTKPFDPEKLLVSVQLAAKSARLSREHRGLKAVVGSSLPTKAFAVESRNDFATESGRPYIRLRWLGC